MSANITYQADVDWNANDNSASSIVFSSVDVTAGELIIVSTRWEGGGLNDAATATIADTAGNSSAGGDYVLIGYKNTGDSSEDEKVGLWACLSSNNTDATNVVTVTMSASRSYRRGNVSAFSYTGTIELGDTGGGASATSATSWTTSPALDVVSGDLSYVVFGNYNGAGDGTTPTGYTSLFVDLCRMAYKPITGTGTEQPSSTSSGDTYAALTAVFQETAGSSFQPAWANNTNSLIGGL
mgnify:CR=1 FL=1